MMNFINMLLSHKAEIFGGLFFISEALAFIPSIKSNGIFQAIFNFLKGQQAPAV